jgi:hypothetical protein
MGKTEWVWRIDPPTEAWKPTLPGVGGWRRPLGADLCSVGGGRSSWGSVSHHSIMMRLLGACRARDGDARSRRVSSLRLDETAWAEVAY